MILTTRSMIAKSRDLFRKYQWIVLHRPLITVLSISRSIGSFFNLLKCSLGSGIFALPLAFSNAGLAFGGIAIILVGILYGHCIHILVVSSQGLCKRTKTPMFDYPETAAKAFELGPPWMQKKSKLAKAVVEYNLMTAFLDSGVYLIFAASTFHKIFLYSFDIDWSVRTFVLLISIPGNSIIN